MNETMIDTMVDRNDRSPATRGLSMVTAAAVVVGVVIRFWPRSSLWLDEALSVNIASLPVVRMSEALRHDGHPPLYYVLLHFWMKLSGDSDWSVRALSGVISTLTLPLAYLTGRRLGRRSGAEFLGPHRVGLICVSLFATLPFAIRYGAETRMYALVMFLVLTGYLLVDELLKDWPGDAMTPDTRRLGAMGAAAMLNTAALLWTHYWSIWLLGSVGVLALTTMWSRRNHSNRTQAWRGPIWLLAALALGGVLFIPWLPAMSFQAAHTGTPWGAKFGPVSVLVVTLVDFAGGRFGIAQFLSYILVVFMVAAALVRIRSLGDTAGDTDDELLIGRGIGPRVRPELALLFLTLGLGWFVAWTSGNTYSSRYGSVIFPLFVLILAAGIGLVRRPFTTVVVLSVICVASLFGAVGAVRGDRTQAGHLTDAIVADMAAHEGPAVVVACPDQLGVALQRELDKHRVASAITGPVIPFPTAGDPRFVDWVDYSDRNAAADPEDFVKRIQPRITRDTTVYLVSSSQYLTFEGKCDRLADILAAGHPHEMLVEMDTSGLDESASLRVIRPS